VVFGRWSPCIASREFDKNGACLHALGCRFTCGTPGSRDDISPSLLLWHLESNSKMLCKPEYLMLTWSFKMIGLQQISNYSGKSICHRGNQTGHQRWPQGLRSIRLPSTDSVYARKRSFCLEPLPHQLFGAHARRGRGFEIALGDESGQAVDNSHHRQNKH
jgi:hypothetical protein